MLESGWWWSLGLGPPHGQGFGAVLRGALTIDRQG